MTYKVEIKLPLLANPLQSGVRLPDRKPIPYALLKDSEFPAEAEALSFAGKLIRDGHAVSLVDSDGREWSHTKILRRLAER